MNAIHKLLITLIGVFGVSSLALGGGIWYYAQRTDTQGASLTSAAPVVTCAYELNTYLQHSNRRMQEYFTLYDNINTGENQLLADRLMSLTEDIAMLPEQCPDEVNNVLYANYTSVYMTAPIHLHIIITRSTMDGIDNPQTRQALALFFKEVDQAEITSYRLKQFID